MRKAAVKKQITENEASQVTTNYLTDKGVQYYTAGALTCFKLKDLRWKKQGPDYSRIGQSIVYNKRDIDKYLEQCKVQHNVDILDALNNPTPEKLEVIRSEMMNVLFGNGIDQLKETIQS